MTQAVHSWPDLLTTLVQGHDAEPDAIRWAMGELLTGNASPAQIAGFAVALRAKGESIAEILALADAMLDEATPITLNREAVDVVGSGGDRANTVNVSTMAAMVAAAAGARVIKHGNRAASSACGTADCLEALGVVLNLRPEVQAQLLDDIGIVFLFAPLYHPGLRHAAGTRRELGISTTFNFLGPLANPARPMAQAVGVADPVMAARVAGVMTARNCRGLVFHGDDGLDELTTTTTSDLWMFSDGRTVTGSLDPTALGIKSVTVDALVGGDPTVNAAIVRETFAGRPGAVRDIVVLNAAAALLAFHGPDLDQDATVQLEQYLVVAQNAIDSGAAASLLDRWAAASQKLAV